MLTRNSVSALFLLVVFQATVRSAPPSQIPQSQGRAVTWTPPLVEVTLFPGTMQASSVELRATREIHNASLFVVPKIASLFSIESAGLDDVVSEVEYSFPTKAEVPASTLVGTYEGTVHLRENKRTVPHTLKVLIHVVEPSSESIPAQVAIPSSDRIVTDGGGRRLVGDEIVVGLSFETSDPEARIIEIASSTNAVILGAVQEALTFQLQYDVAELDALEEIRLVLQALPDVAFASHHYLLTQPLATTPNDAEYDDWDEANPAGNNWHLEYIEAPSAWDIQTGSSSVVVAVIDADFDAEHTDLNDNVLVTVGSRTKAGGHGTHVAGLICAEGNNGQGVAGVSWDCSLGLYDAEFLTLRALELMIQAVNDGSRIMNMSLGVIPSGAPADDETLQAVSEANAVLGRGILFAEREGKDVLWVFAAGNESRDVRFQSPASLTGNFPLNTIAVAAIDDDGELSSFSNFGELVTVAAPGGEVGFLGFPETEIFSTLPRFCVPLFSKLCFDRYGGRIGTSQAAPQVAGLAALVLSEHPDFLASQVKECILAGALSRGAPIPGHDFKVINAPAAVKCEEELALPEKVDLIFSLDLTGSMGGEITRVKAEVGDIITNLIAAAPSTDFLFAVVSYEDYAGSFDSRPCGSTYSATYGSAGDEPFRIDLKLTDDTDAVKATVEGLALGHGADGPQSYARVFWEIGQADTGGELGFRADALKLVINFADNVPHDTDLNEGFGDPLPPPFPTFDRGIDPGRNATIDCDGDDIDFQDDALAALIDREIRLIDIDSSGSSQFGQYWQLWTSQTGGAFAAINPDGTIPGGLDLTALIIDLLKLID